VSLSRHRARVSLAAAALALGWLAGALRDARAADDVLWSPREKPLAERIDHLRDLDGDARGAATEDLALEIRALPRTANKLRLAIHLSALSTEGDFGHSRLEAVAATLAAAVREEPVPWKDPSASSPGKFDPALMPAYAYRTLAQLARYEDVHVALAGDPHFRAAMATLETEDRKRERPDFALSDLSGHSWNMADLRGRVVLVNFWATWCPPCRKEIPSLQALAARFGPQGLVVLGISDEEAGKVERFVREHTVSYPVLLDPGRAVNTAFAIQGIPKTFVYDRTGRLVAESIDMRTEGQFLAMLAKAGLR
jgi:peroxiredoxin